MLTREQLEMRRHFVGASEVACILGISPHGNIHSVWAEKMGLKVDAPTVEQESGHYLEAALANWYAAETGYRFAHFGTVVHPRHPFMGCTPDLCVYGQRRIGQIKNVGMWMAHHWDDDVPQYVEAQVQAEMEVCDVDVCDVVALIGGTDFRILPIERDREIGGYIVEVCREFVEKYVRPREIPPVDESGHAERALKALYARDRSGMIKPTPEIDQLAKAWLSADKALGDAEKARTGLANQLKAILGDSEGVEGDSYRVKWKTNKAGARVFTVKSIAMRKASAA